MKTKQAKVTIKGNEVHNIKHQTFVDLSESIWNLIFRKESQFDVAIKLENGDKAKWEPVMAHYCFTLGRITTEKFAEEVFKMEATV